MFTIGLLLCPGCLTSSSFSSRLHTELISQPEISLESRHFRQLHSLPHLMQEAPTLPPPETTATPRTSPPTPGCCWPATTGTTTRRCPGSVSGSVPGRAAGTCSPRRRTGRRAPTAAASVWWDSAGRERERCLSCHQ